MRIVQVYPASICVCTAGDALIDSYSIADVCDVGSHTAAQHHAGVVPPNSPQAQTSTTSIITMKDILRWMQQLMMLSDLHDM